MDNKEVIFKFKKFNMNHGLSSMRIGVDAVLLGAWCDISGVDNVLDVGTGCGVIALMIAQRLPYGKIEGIDIDLPSVEEASKNFASSPWRNRCCVEHINFLNYVKTYKDRTENYKNGIDLIISNPPYFDSGVKTYNTARILARHQGAELSPSVLLREGVKLLSYRGRIAIIVPTDIGERMEDESDTYGLITIRKCYVRGHEKAPYKRILMEFGQYEYYHNRMMNSVTFLTLEEKSGYPTEDYRNLCREFYLKF
ncbi:MAG: methyltransferase [Muribaculaceae bacterium]|nr:methyltransferase [Muribaculaceae bacterium]